MTEEILINATAQETRVAVLERGALREMWIERRARAGIVGGIYLGVVARVLPGMQAAFVEIGSARAAFLHARDLPGGAADSIATQLRVGQRILVQATKEPVGDKGARLSARLSLAAPTLVYLPHGDGLNLSKRIDDAAARARLTALLTDLHAELAGDVYDGNAYDDNARDGGLRDNEPLNNKPRGDEHGNHFRGGFILRTAAEDAARETIRGDMARLLRDWEDLRQRARRVDAPALLRANLPLALRAVRDFAGRGAATVRVDCADTYRRVKAFADETMTCAPRIEHYAEPRPIFDLRAVEDDLRGALQRRVALPSGGDLIFDQTEAMTTVDINTGSFVGARDFGDTALRTNLEAAAEIARQLRLRNIGGIVIVDFIELRDDDDRAEVIDALRRELARDRDIARVGAFSPLGLVEIARKRTRASLEQVLTEPCPACRGRGVRTTAETACYDILRQLLRQTSAGRSCRVLAAPAVIERLRFEEADSLNDLQQRLGATIELQAAPEYRHDEFDVVAR
ncbi:MAG: ribonuclease E/G [bacterium]